MSSNELGISRRRQENACRREHGRRRIRPSKTVVWFGHHSPREVAAIEVDTRGARLVVPWVVSKDDNLIVSYSNGLGLHRTEGARVAWTESLDSAGQTIVGVYYQDREAKVA